MNKSEFLGALRYALGKLPSYEVEQTITFYAEMIDDRVEEGMSEQDAVAQLGSIDAIAAQITAETPPIPKAIAKAKTGSRTLNIVLLVAFSPIWAPIALAFAISVFAIYIAIWAVVVSLWAVVISLLICGPVGIFGLFWLLATGFPLPGVWILGCGLAAAGLGLLAWFGTLAASKGLIQLTSAFARKVKSLFVRLNKSEAGTPMPYPAQNTAPNTVPYATPGAAPQGSQNTAPYAAPGAESTTEGQVNHD